MANFHYTGPTGPDPTRPDKVPGLFSGRDRIVEFSYCRPFTTSWRVATRSVGGRESGSGVSSSAVEQVASQLSDNENLAKVLPK